MKRDIHMVCVCSPPPPKGVPISPSTQAVVSTVSLLSGSNTSAVTTPFTPASAICCLQGTHIYIHTRVHITCSTAIHEAAVMKTNCEAAMHLWLASTATQSCWLAKPHKTASAELSLVAASQARPPPRWHLHNQALLRMDRTSKRGSVYTSATTPHELLVYVRARGGSPRPR